MGKEISDFRAQNSALKGFMVVMQQMTHTAQRAREKFAKWEMQVSVPALKNSFNEESCS